LERRGVVAHGRDGVKLLGEGEAPRGLAVRVHKASAAARKKIEDAGGTVEIIG
jgi:large subunit ribosomal protein L15